MTIAKSRMLKGKIRNVYFDLVSKFPLVSIRTESDFKAAQEVIDKLLTSGDLSAGEELYLDALSDLVAAYEDDHYQIEPASDAEMLRHLMDAKGINQMQLHRATNIAKSTISELLSGKKVLSRQLIRTLSEYFDVDKSILARNL